MVEEWNGAFHTWVEGLRGLATAGPRMSIMAILGKITGKDKIRGVFGLR